MIKQSVYVMISGDMCKIGISKDVERRRKELSVGCPDIFVFWQSEKLFTAHKIEKEIHNKYNSFSVSGE